MRVPLYRIILVISIVLLLGFYVFQKNIMGVFDTYDLSHDQIFILKKSVRFIINDVLMIGVIYGIFNNLSYIRLAIFVQLLGIVFLLIPYLYIKLYIGGYNGPLISFLHRLVLNPLLMILLIPALYYQESLKSKAGD